jgi:hypothetical protein
MRRGSGTLQLLFGSQSAVRQHPRRASAEWWANIQLQLIAAASKESWRWPPAVSTSPYFSARAFEQLRPLRYLAISPNYYEGDYGFEIVIASDPSAEQPNFSALTIGTRSLSITVRDRSIIYRKRLS